MNKPNIKTNTYLLLISTIALSFTGCETNPTDSGRMLFSYTLTEVNGNNQTVTPDGDESDPIVVRVDLNDSPVSGITVEWNITEGDGSLSSNSGVSDEDGLVQTTYISGNSTGDVRIGATVNFDSSGFENFAGREVTPVTFTLNVTTD